MHVHKIEDVAIKKKILQSACNPAFKTQSNEINNNHKKLFSIYFLYCSRESTDEMIVLVYFNHFYLFCPLQMLICSNLSPRNETFKTVISNHEYAGKQIQTNIREYYLYIFKITALAVSYMCDRRDAIYRIDFFF